MSLLDEDLRRLWETGTGPGRVAALVVAVERALLRRRVTVSRRQVTLAVARALVDHDRAVTTTPGLLETVARESLEVSEDERVAFIDQRLTTIAQERLDIRELVAGIVAGVLELETRLVQEIEAWLKEEP